MDKLEYQNKLCYLENHIVRAELLQVGILFGTQFPSLGIFISKKVRF
jgi:hypothetical protein